MAKILLVEDDKSLREIYGVRLMAEGYEIVSAGDGEEALAMAIKERPDLIVSDVMMPKISGFDMLDILRSTSETKDVKVIMMTALSSDDQRARGESLGADRYLVKSQVGIEDVVRTVHDVLGDSIAAPAAPSFPPAGSTPTAPPAPSADPTAVPQAPVAATQPPVEPTEAPLPAPAAPADPALANPTAPVTLDLPSAPAAAPLPAAAPPQAPVPVAPQPLQQPQPAPLGAPVPDFQPAPAPAAPAAPVAPPAFTPLAPSPAAPAPQPAAPVPAPAAPAAQPTLPQPTAPFSSPGPASLGERVIEPLSNPAATPQDDIAAQIEQALGAATPPQGPPQVPPAA